MRKTLSLVVRLVPLLLLLALPSGCADDGMRLPPPGPPHFSLSGHIRLVGILADEANANHGLRSIDDATGVMVRLSGTDGVVDSTRTTDGTYVFRDLPPGGYQARAGVVATATVATGILSLLDHDIVAPDTLVLDPFGDLSTYPNPGAPEGIGIEFTAHAAQTYTVDVRSLAGEVVWTFSQTVPEGFYHVHWDGDDLEERLAPAGAYWVVVRVDDHYIYALVFWPADAEPANSGNCGHIEANGLVLDVNGATVVSSWFDEQRGDLQTQVGEWSADIQMQFLRPDSTTFAIADTCRDNHLTWSLADTSIATVELVPERKWSFRLFGHRGGSTELTLNGWHLDHVHFRSLPIPIVVTRAETSRP